MKKISLILLLFVFGVHYFSTAQTYGSFTDKRDGRTYQTVQIGNQIWMAENLNYNPGISCFCYNDSDNCDKYGRLYSWKMANFLCPLGWRLPSQKDFETLMDNVKNDKTSMYYTLIEGGSSGFNALMGGRYTTKYEFENKYGNWWSSTQYGDDKAWYLHMYSVGKTVSLRYFNKDYDLSVRCIKE